MVDTGLEVGLEVAVVVQLPLFAHHQTGAAGKGAGIVLIHVHAVAGGEIHALYPVPGKLQLRLDEQAVIKTEHASHFLADAPRIGMVGAVDRRAVQHAGPEALVVPVPAQHGVRVPAVGMLPGGVGRDAVGAVFAGTAMQAVDALVGFADLATQAQQPFVVFILLQKTVVTEGRAVKILAEIRAAQAGKAVLLGKAAYPQAVRAVTVTDLPQALAQIGELAQVHGIGRGHARKPQGHLACRGKPFRPGKVPFPAVVPFARFQGIAMDPYVDHLPPVDVFSAFQRKGACGGAHALFRPGQIAFGLHRDGFRSACFHMQAIGAGQGVAHQDTVGNIRIHIRPQIKAPGPGKMADLQFGGRVRLGQHAPLRRKAGPGVPLPLPAAHIDAGAVQGELRQIAGVPAVVFLRELVGGDHFPYGIFAERQLKITKAACPAPQVAAILDGCAHGGAAGRRLYIAFHGRGPVHRDGVRRVPLHIQRVDVLTRGRGCGRDGGRALQADIARRVVDRYGGIARRARRDDAIRQFDRRRLASAGFPPGTEAVGLLAFHAYPRRGPGIAIGDPAGGKGVHAAGSAR